MKVLVLLLALCTHCAVVGKKRKHKGAKDSQLLRKAKSLSLDNLNAFCDTQPRFCSKYYKDIYEKVIQRLKDREEKKIKKIKDLTLKELAVRRLSSIGNIEEVDCDLSARVYPLIYFGQTRTLQFVLNFSSNCLDNPYLMYFVTPWDQNFDLSFEEHPSFVSFTIFGRKVEFKFSQVVRRGEVPQINLAYPKVMLSPSKNNAMINTFLDNEVELIGVNNLINLREINEILSAPNPYNCKVIQNREIFECMFGLTPSS